MIAAPLTLHELCLEARLAHFPTSRYMGSKQAILPFLHQVLRVLMPPAKAQPEVVHGTAVKFHQALDGVIWLITRPNGTGRQSLFHSEDTMPAKHKTRKVGPCVTSVL